MTGIQYTGASGDGLCRRRLFDVMPLRDSVVRADGNELARTGVQSVSVGSVGRAPLSVETRDMPATTNVAVSTVFDRFRNMRLYSFGSHSVRQSAPIIHHVSVSTVDERGCVHTRPLITGSLQESSSSRAICGPGVAGYVGSSSRIAPSNHAYLCLDVADGVVRPKIVPFTRHTPSYIDLGDCDQQCHHCGCLFWYGERIRNNNYARIRNFAGREEDMLNPDIVQGLLRVLDEHHGLVRLFRTARDRCNAGEIPWFKIRLYNNGGARGYELPGSDVLGGIVFEDGPQSRTDFDVIIEFRGGFPKRINKLHQSYMSLQFPLLFVFGEPGYYPELLLKPKDGSGRGMDKSKITRKQSKPSKHGHENQKSTRPKPKEAKPQPKP
ncbi:hypothetical protein Tco_0859524 [Tanacetum coccineum]|uniref:Helitron helicase-like domain-containing protein n=1 Tax=Tanacetum coccineum TaxID=301880 RepID=A0ABQ5BEF9_9ASTR